MRAYRGALAREDEARDGLCRPACKTGDEASPRVTIPELSFSSRRSMRRVSGSNRGRAMGGERSVRFKPAPLINQHQVSESSKIWPTRCHLASRQVHGVAGCGARFLGDRCYLVRRACLTEVRLRGPASAPGIYRSPRDRVQATGKGHLQLGIVTIVILAVLHRAIVRPRTKSRALRL